MMSKTLHITNNLALLELTQYDIQDKLLYNEIDEQGSFVHNVNAPGVYILSLNHRGLSLESTPFILRDGEQHKPLI